MPRPYPKEFREGAVTLARQGERPVSAIAKELGIAESCLRNWLKQDQVDRRVRDDGATSAEREELRRLRRENARLREEREILRKAGGLLRPGGDPVTAFGFIAAEKANHPISVMCRMLEVSRSGFHAWEHRPPSDRALSDAWLVEKIKEIHDTNRGVYGAPRIHAELRLAHGIQVGRKRVERLMRQAGLSGLVPKRRGRTTIRVPGVRVADDLVGRQFRPATANVLWVADITYLRTWEGWLYLAAVQDAYSRRIVGWSMADHMLQEIVIDALNMAVARRQPDAGLIHHSDQGGQFVSLGFGQAAGKAGISRSMGSRGDCFDNAVAETFFATLKKELIHRRSWPEREELRREVFDYIEIFYNATRRHSTLGMLSPAAYEKINSLEQQNITNNN
ncbi:MAG: IS3 family transposase [Actinomycetota bacterium]|nr:IS3 family transposase [Actinomycetota bacterium]